MHLGSDELSSMFIFTNNMICGITSCSFYIMLTGRMSVYIDTTRTDEETPVDGKEEESEKKKVEDVTPNDKNGLDFDQNSTPKRDKKPLDRSQFGKFIMYFGECQSLTIFFLFIFYNVCSVETRFGCEFCRRKLGRHSVPYVLCKWVFVWSQWAI